jgi:hypothetical protein
MIKRWLATIQLARRFSVQNRVPDTSRMLHAPPQRPRSVSEESLVSLERCSSPSDMPVLAPGRSETAISSFKALESRHKRKRPPDPYLSALVG